MPFILCGCGWLFPHCSEDISLATLMLLGSGWMALNGSPLDGFA